MFYSCLQIIVTQGIEQCITLHTNGKITIHNFNQSFDDGKNFMKLFKFHVWKRGFSLFNYKHTKNWQMTVHEWHVTFWLHLLFASIDFHRFSSISLFSSNVIVAFWIALVIALEDTPAVVLPSHLWLFLVLKCRKRWGQCWQEYGFSPVWMRKWVFSWCCWANWRPHSVHCKLNTRIELFV